MFILSFRFALKTLRKYFQTNFVYLQKEKWTKINEALRAIRDRILYCRVMNRPQSKLEFQVGIFDVFTKVEKKFIVHYKKTKM